MFDLGFLGVKKLSSTKIVIITYQEGERLRAICYRTETVYNKKHSAKRILVEHAICCRIKKYRIVNDVFRNRLSMRVSNIVSGLANYRLMNTFQLPGR
jgi:hypothetical protein